MKPANPVPMWKVTGFIPPQETGVPKRTRRRRKFKQRIVPDKTIIEGIFEILKSRGKHKAKKIADQLDISLSTVLRHLKIIKLVQEQTKVTHHYSDATYELCQVFPDEDKENEKMKESHKKPRKPFVFIDLTKGKHLPRHKIEYLDEERGILWIERRGQIYYSLVYPDTAKEETEWPLIIESAPPDLLEEIGEVNFL